MEDLKELKEKLGTEFSTKIDEICKLMKFVN